MNRHPLLVRIVLPLLAALLSAAPCYPRDIFVSNTSGDDRFTGLALQSGPDLSGPVRTLGRALALARSGDRIILENTDRPYRESVSLTGSRHSGYPGHPLTILGNGATLDGSAPVPPDAWKHYRGAVFRFLPPRKGRAMLFLDGRPATRVVPETGADAPPDLEPTEWCFLGGWIYFCVEKTSLPANYALSYAHLPVGMTLVHVEGVAIVDLTVQGFVLDGVSAHNSARDVLLAELTCRGNGRSGIAVGGASSVTIDACLVGSNGQAQVLALPYSRAHIRNSDLLDDTAPPVVDRGGDVSTDDPAAD